MSKRTALDFIMLGEPWAITREALDTVLSVAQRNDLDPEALALRLGRPLENTRAVSMQGNGVAVIPLSGPIFPKANLFTEISGATSLEQFMQDVTAANDNPAVRAIVLDINSPGGQTTGVHEVMTMLRGLDKPVTAYVSGMAASAAYLLASGANRIVMDPMSMAGSIGVVLSVPPKRADAPLEIVSSQSPDKRPDHATEPGRAVYQSLVDDMASVFLGAVADNRGKTPEHIAGARGGMLVGQKAVDFGLADALGSLDSVIAEASAHTLSTTPRRGGKTMTTQKEDAVFTAADMEQTKAAGFEAGKAEGAKTATAAERTRIGAILNHPEAKGREAQAITLALETDMAPEAAAKVLASGAKAQPTGANNGFAAAMTALGNTNLGADAESAGEPQEQAAIDAAWCRMIGKAA